MLEFFGEPISSYSRKRAVEDGVLIDVSETAKKAGIGPGDNLKSVITVMLPGEG